MVAEGKAFVMSLMKAPARPKPGFAVVSRAPKIWTIIMIWSDDAAQQEVSLLSLLLGQSAAKAGTRSARRVSA